MKKILLILFLLIFILIGCNTKEYTAKNLLEITLNQEINLPETELSMIITEVGDVDELKPDNPTGYYDFYDKQEGYHYFVITGLLKNPNGNVVNYNMLKSKAYSKTLFLSNEIESKFLIQNGARTAFYEKDTVAQEVKFHIVTIIKDGKENPEQFKIYYNSNLSIDENLEDWDYCITYNVNNKK